MRVTETNKNAGGMTPRYVKVKSFADGTVMVRVHAPRGAGQTAFLTPAQARRVAAAMMKAAGGGR